MKKEKRRTKETEYKFKISLEEVFKQLSFA